MKGQGWANGWNICPMHLHIAIMEMPYADLLPFSEHVHSRSKIMSYRQALFCFQEVK